MERHIKHDTNGFRPVPFMLHLWIGNDNRQISLVPCRKHAQQTSLTNQIAVQVGNGKPKRVFGFMVDGNASFHLFLGGRLLKPTLKHNLRLIEPIGIKRHIFFSLLPQNNPFPSDLFLHMFS